MIGKLALRAIRSLDQVIEWRGKPLKIRSDNGPECVSDAFREWAVRSDIVLQLIEPGKPQQNVYIERYNITVPYDGLTHYLFETVSDVQESATKWLWTYNHERPNLAIGGVPPKRKLLIAA
ncbi:integrase, catalytic region [Pandoraea horticolens]|uniref:Integrase, catalytic region n=1 Tax=Pandoraea horticolens TaxID=2508298 RepID=A0A5E4WGE7_9BURK|nr:integrase, catalytic region [Pandoraea horticolens]